MKYDTVTTDDLDILATQARAELADITGKPTAAEVVARMYANMVRAFGGGYHPDTPFDGYVDYPEGYLPQTVCALQIEADEHGIDEYELTLEAAL